MGNKLNFIPLNPKIIGVSALSTKKSHITIETQSLSQTLATKAPVTSELVIVLVGRIENATSIPSTSIDVKLLTSLINPQSIN